MADQRGIADLYSPEDFDDVAYELNDDFLMLKHTLVSQRKKKRLTQLQIAEFLGTSVQWVNDFEQYDYDPLASEIRAYALAVMMRIRTEAKPLPEPDLVCHLASDSDQVNHPKHYAANKPFECIELADKYSFALGNAIKYAFRYEDKDRPVEDLKKASWYIRYAIDHDEQFLEPIDWHDEDLCNSYIDILQNAEKNKNMQQFWKHFKNGETDACLNDLEQRIAELQKKA